MRLLLPTLVELPLAGNLVLPVGFLILGIFQEAIHQKRVKENIAPRLGSYGGSPSFSDFNSFLHPYLVSVLLRANDLCPIPSHDVVLLHNMVCDRGFMD